MATIYDVVNSKFTSVRWQEDDKDRTPFLLEAWFPTEKQLGNRQNLRPHPLSFQRLAPKF